MAHPTTTPDVRNVFEDLGISQPDVEIAKADLAIRIHRLAEHQHLTAKDAAALLKVPESELPALFQGRLASCSLDQLLRVLTWLGDDIEILVRPRRQRSKRGSLRVLQLAPVERFDDVERLRPGRSQRSASSSPPDPSHQEVSANTSAPGSLLRDEQLLDKYSLEKMTSLDITTIYRKMAAGTFPQPVKVGRRRVAWRTGDILQWQQHLEVGTEPLRMARPREASRGSEGGRKRGRQ